MNDYEPHDRLDEDEELSGETPAPASDDTFANDHEIAHWNARLAQQLRDRGRRLDDARALVPGTVSYGAANYPHDPDVWLADWRDNLPNGDPRRSHGPPIVRNGTAEAYHSMKAAHDAIREAYDSPSDDGISDA